MLRIFFRAALVCVLAVPGLARAEDAWDVTSNGDDDGPGTDTELAPGTFEVHDMEAVAGLADQDWFIVSQRPYSSYEVVVDGLTEGLAFVGAPVTPLSVQLVMSDGTLVNGSVGLGASGSARVLHFRNDIGAAVENTFVRVSSPLCDTTCSTFEQYRIHMHDTTSMIPRYNNSATQVSILILQNASDAIVLVAAHFFDSAGAHLAVQFDAIPPFGTYIVNSSTIPGLAGTGGSVIVTQGGRYGALSGKMVALEPATGFTFDTALLPRPQ